MASKASVGKLRPVLDYWSCETCLEQPTPDQDYFCGVCRRLNRDVVVADGGMATAGDAVRIVTAEEWERSAPAALVATAALAEAADEDQSDQSDQSDAPPEDLEGAELVDFDSTDDESLMEFVPADEDDEAESADQPVPDEADFEEEDWEVVDDPGEIAAWRAQLQASGELTTEAPPAPEADWQPDPADDWQPAPPDDAAWPEIAVDDGEPLDDPPETAMWEPVEGDESDEATPAQALGDAPAMIDDDYLESEPQEVLETTGSDERQPADVWGAGGDDEGAAPWSGERAEATDASSPVAEEPADAQWEPVPFDAADEPESTFGSPEGSLDDEEVGAPDEVAPDAQEGGWMPVRQDDEPDAALPEMEPPEPFEPDEADGPDESDADAWQVGQPADEEPLDDDLEPVLPEPEPWPQPDAPAFEEPMADEEPEAVAPEFLPEPELASDDEIVPEPRPYEEPPMEFQPEPAVVEAPAALEARQVADEIQEIENQIELIDAELGLLAAHERRSGPRTKTPKRRRTTTKARAARPKRRTTKRTTSSYSTRGYHLYRKNVKNADGSKRPFFFFAKDERRSDAGRSPLPDAYRVAVNARNGLPYLKKKKTESKRRRR